MRSPYQQEISLSNKTTPRLVIFLDSISSKLLTLIRLLSNNMNCNCTNSNYTRTESVQLIRSIGFWSGFLHPNHQILPRGNLWLLPELDFKDFFQKICIPPTNRKFNLAIKPFQVQWYFLMQFLQNLQIHYLSLNTINCNCNNSKQRDVGFNLFVPFLTFRRHFEPVQSQQFLLKSTACYNYYSALARTDHSAISNCEMVRFQSTFVYSCLVKCILPLIPFIKILPPNKLFSNTTGTGTLRITNPTLNKTDL